MASESEGLGRVHGQRRVMSVVLALEEELGGAGIEPVRDACRRVAVMAAAAPGAAQVGEAGACGGGIAAGGCPGLQAGVVGGAAAEADGDVEGAAMTGTGLLKDDAADATRQLELFGSA